jgi:UMF1 family MFS transporter
MKNLLDRIGLGRPDLRAWAMYDWANSAYQTTIIAAVFPVYYIRVAGSGLEKEVAASRLAWASAIAIMIVAILAPVLGAIADNSPIKKRLLGIFMGIGVVSCFGMFWITDGDWLLALSLFIIGNVGVAGSIVFYEALLPHLVGTGDLDRVSSAGYAIGYLGGGVLLAINAVMIMNPALFGLADAGMATRIAFVTVGLWWLAFSIPLFLKVAEPRALASQTPQPISFSGAIRQLAGTFHELRKYRQALLFLAAFLVYNDGIQTMIRMATSYGETIGIDSGAMIMALLLTQFIGVPAAFAFGAVASKIGAKIGILIGLSVYAVITVLGYYMTTAAHFFALAILVGLVQGGTQALSRSVYASMIPRQKSSEFFAIFSVFERYAGVLGPLLFGLVITWTGSGRNAILAILIFFIAGAALLLPVDIAAGRRQARADEEAIEAAH